MIRKILLIFSALLLSTLSIHAQAIDKKLDKTAKTAATETCTCFNEVMNSFHPQIVKMMQNIVEVGEAEATKELTAYLAGLSQEEQAAFMKEIERLQKMESILEEQCGNMEEKYAAYKDNDAFTDRVEYYLEQEDSCQLLAEIMKKTRKEDKE